MFGEGQLTFEKQNFCIYEKGILIIRKITMLTNNKVSGQLPMKHTTLMTHPNRRNEILKKFLLDEKTSKD